MAVEPGDLYEILGVAADASREEIVHAYRRQAHSAHPDVRPGDPGASARFQAMTQAYRVLSDPARRAAYDRQRPTSPPPASPPSRDPASGRRAGAAEIWPGPEIWAGPVHIEPHGSAAPAPFPEVAAQARADRLAAILELLFPGDGWGWYR